MNATNATGGKASEPDAHAELRDLREQVEALMRHRVSPAVADAAEKLGDAARGEAEALAKQVRERPLTALLIAGVAGFLLGRITR